RMDDSLDTVAACAHSDKVGSIGTPRGKAEHALVIEWQAAWACLAVSNRVELRRTDGQRRLAADLEGRHRRLLATEDTDPELELIRGADLRPCGDHHGQKART
ncbi:MAG TPA: hypothetical protein VE170_05920, partial [Candidatus Limnocylindria bacterium]|nr:hypothetical protein [Candidatus Limnocylindria bacterium]